jgi:glycosyltransferase involved in cell wall biosynthesis
LALLAPLRFGAGIKGKVLEAWGTGTPVVGNELTFEGMGAGGIFAERSEDYVEACALIHESANEFTRIRDKALERVRTIFHRDHIARDFLSIVEKGLGGLGELRARNLTGRMLRHQSLNSMKYFSRWIEAKKASGISSH